MRCSETFNLHVLVRLAAIAAAALIVPISSGGPSTRGAPATTGRATALSQPVRVGRLAHPGLTECSGIVASRKYPGVYWSMNDSGHPPMLYAVDATGKALYRAGLTGARNIDWEDIAGDAAGRLYIGDFGDNSRNRKVLTIYILDEPGPKAARAAVPVKSKCRFRYPAGHGPFDCEAMFVRGRWAYLITKELTSARLYRVRLDAAGGKVVQAEDIGPMPGARWVTAADISPDGRRIAVLSYVGVWVYQLDRPLDKVAAAAVAATQSAPASRPAHLVRVKPIKRGVGLRQAEAICWESGPCPGGLLITNEQREVYRMRLLGPAASQPASRERRPAK